MAATMASAHSQGGTHDLGLPSRIAAMTAAPTMGIHQTGTPVLDPMMNRTTISAGTPTPRINWNGVRSAG